jgi:hypothetical protein
MGAVPRTISASIDSALFGLPQESVSPAINHSAAAYAYRATRRNGALHGHDVLVSPVGREVVVRAEHDIDEQWHGECDGEVVEAWLASLQSRDTCQPEADVSSEHRRRMESESEWSFLGTIDRAGSDRTASGILEMDTLLRGVPEILQAERLSSKGLLPQVQIGSDSRYTDLLHPEGVDQERQSSSAASPHLLAATWAPHPPATVDGEAMEHSKPNRMFFNSAESLRNTGIASLGVVEGSTMVAADVTVEIKVDHIKCGGDTIEGRISTPRQDANRYLSLRSASCVRD